MEISHFNIEEPASHIDLYLDPTVRACTNFWGYKFWSQGVADMTGEDLHQEAWLRSWTHLSDVAPENRKAYVRQTVRTTALMRLQRGREVPDDPFDGRIAGVVAPDRAMDEAEAEAFVEDVLRFLDHNAPLIRDRLVKVFGPSQRVESVLAASALAIKHLVLQDTRLSIDEILSMSMRRVDPFWRTDGAPGEPAERVAERRKKRLLRDLPRVSYCTLWEALRWALADHREACQALAARHVKHAEVALRDCRNPDRRAAIERHLFAVRQAAGESPDSDPQ